MTRKQRRLILIGAGGGVLAIAVALVLNAMSGSIVFFNSPTDVVEKKLAAGTRMRFEDPLLEKKPGEWKLCYRAGREAVAAARAAATAWLATLQP